MKIFSLVISFLVYVMSVTVYAAGKPPTCADIPLSMTFVAPVSAPAAIYNDDPTKAYQNGVDGVQAIIHITSGKCNGTRDATLTLYKSKRHLSWKFPLPIPGSIIQSGPPSFAGGNAFSNQAHVNIHNLLGHTVLTPGVAATFYTKVGSSGIAAPDGGSYTLRLLPRDFTCPAGATCVPNLECPACDSDPIINVPVEAAWAKVTYTPRDRTQPWSLSNTDSWIVEAEYVAPGDTAIERATTLLNGVHYGQYSMPFKILITALAPLP